MLSTHHQREQAAREFLDANPEIEPLFVALTREYLEATGSPRCSASLIVGKIRWEHEVIRQAAEPFKINDHVSAFLARWTMEKHPDLDGVFELRRQKVTVAERLMHEAPELSRVGMVAIDVEPTR